jgi:hypothetical protein
MKSNFSFSVSHWFLFLWISLNFTAVIGTAINLLANWHFYTQLFQLKSDLIYFLKFNPPRFWLINSFTGFSPFHANPPTCTTTVNKHSLLPLFESMARNTCTHMSTFICSANSVNYDPERTFLARRTVDVLWIRRCHEKGRMVWKFHYCCREDVTQLINIALSQLYDFFRFILDSQQMWYDRGPLRAEYLLWSFSYFFLCVCWKVLSIPSRAFRLKEKEMSEGKENISFPSRDQRVNYLFRNCGYCRKT